MRDERPIVFATDGSPSATEAQHEAFELARALDTALIVVSVEHAAMPVVGYSAYGYGQVLAELTKAERHRVEKLLASVAIAASADGVTCSTVAAHGFPTEEICRIAGEHDARLIVVGSHGWGAAHRFLSGSVSTGLVHSAPCPVLVSRRDANAQERAAA